MRTIGFRSAFWVEGFRVRTVDVDTLFLPRESCLTL